jgi:hypothetical protein
MNDRAVWMHRHVRSRLPPGVEYTKDTNERYFEGCVDVRDGDVWLSYKSKKHRPRLWMTMPTQHQLPNQPQLETLVEIVAFIDFAGKEVRWLLVKPISCVILRHPPDNWFLTGRDYAVRKDMIDAIQCYIDDNLTCVNILATKSALRFDEEKNTIVTILHQFLFHSICLAYHVLDFIILYPQ